MIIKTVGNHCYYQLKKTLFKRVIAMQIFGATQLETDLLTAWSNDLFIPTYRRVRV